MTSDAPHEPDPMLDADRAAPGLSRQVLRWGSYALGLGLLVACLGYALYKGEWDRLQQASPFHLAGLCVLILASLSMNALLFQLALRPMEQQRPLVGWGLWQVLMAASALLNYLPKAGLVGRMAYLKKRHDIPLRASALSLLLVAAGTAIIYFILGALTVWREGIDWLWAGALALLLAAGSLTTPSILRLVCGRLVRSDLGWAKLAAGCGAWYGLRVADAFCFAGRFYLAAQIFGSPVSFPAAMVVGLACNFVVMVAPIPGGVGLKEWLGAALLGMDFLGGLPLQTGTSVLLVDRAAEILVFFPVGGAGLWILHRIDQKKRAAQVSTDVHSPQTSGMSAATGSQASAAGESHARTAGSASGEV